VKKIDLGFIHDINKDEFVEYKINDYTIEEVFGVSIIDYLKIHNKTIDELINEVKINVNILKSNLKERLNNDLLDDLTEFIKQKLNDKEKHLKRLEELKKLYNL